MRMGCVEMKKIIGLLLLTFCWMLPAQAMVEPGTEKGDRYAFSYPVVTVEDPQAQAAIQADIDGYLANLREHVASHSMVMEAKTAYDVKYEDAEVLSLTLTSYEYTGGAHGMYVIYGLNYDKRTGARLPLDNYLKVTVPDLQEAVGKHLYNGSGKKIPFHWTATVKRVPVDYYLLGNGAIALQFQPYELGPYADGATTIRFSGEEVAAYNAR